MSNTGTGKYPMLEAILAIQDLPLQPMYTNRDGPTTAARFSAE